MHSRKFLSEVLMFEEVPQGTKNNSPRKLEMKPGR